MIHHQQQPSRPKSVTSGGASYNSALDWRATWFFLAVADYYCLPLRKVRTFNLRSLFRVLSFRPTSGLWPLVFACWAVHCSIVLAYAVAFVCIWTDLLVSCLQDLDVSADDADS